MTTLVLGAHRTYLAADYSVKSWLAATDHKRIAILYLLSIGAMFLVGGTAAALMRLQLMAPNNDWVSGAVYAKLFTVHGISMVWFFLIPAIPTVLGNFVLPLTLGARGVAFPRLNLVSWYLFGLGLVLILSTALFGAVDTGWTFFTPYSVASPEPNVVMTLLGILCAGLSSILTGINFIATIHTMRAPGLTWSRLPLFVWGLYCTSLILILATPVLIATLVLLLFERVLRAGIFDVQLGGDPVLYQHLFWFYAYPAVYVMYLAGIGVVSDIIAAFTGRRLFGHTAIAAAMAAIMVLGFLGWGTRMLSSGISLELAIIASVTSIMVAGPVAVIIVCWVISLFRSSAIFDTPMLYAMGFIATFGIGGATALLVTNLGTGIHLHDTYFDVASFHYLVPGSVTMAFMGGLHYWWPKMTGRLYSEAWGRITAWTLFLAFNAAFQPQLILGYLGMPRRYFTYPPELQALNVMSTGGALLLGLAYTIAVIYLLGSLRSGYTAGPNPWKADGLEWETASPPPPANFDDTPVVTRKLYSRETLEDAGDRV